MAVQTANYFPGMNFLQNGHHFTLRITCISVLVGDLHSDHISIESSVYVCSAIDADVRLIWVTNLSNGGITIAVVINL